MIAFSQPGTKIDSSINLKKVIARLVVKDLLKKDSLEAEHITLTKNYELLSQNIQSKDSIITSKNTQIADLQTKENNYLFAVDMQNMQNTNLKNGMDGLNKEIKRYKSKLFVRTTLAVSVIGGLVYLLVK